MGGWGGVSVYACLRLRVRLLVYVRVYVCL